ncbi:3-dehydroquinate synthase [uncultured Bacteroides sp.]|uniref:3-dehydroquinate synthase n=1 Tax=uncultured Bacteroides sp. TaxID=162156 RepID=UPI00280B3829|nr:3-dehydroquinate synthase [uncultured Bacteroides sp.]
MSKQEVIICQNFTSELQQKISAHSYDKIFVLTDEHTSRFCLPLLQDISSLKKAEQIVIGPEDIHKNLETLAYVWNQLSSRGATRHTLLINLGGGMVTDLGGFAAATFKRGISYINIPTTLLSMVDAAVGGKTGINFNDLKNEIGAFYPADQVLIDSEFLKTLDIQNLLSGYGEMLKHGLISNQAHWSELLNFDFNQIDYSKLQTLIGQSVKVKEDIVEKDPYEQNIRKALNFGHTIGHAFESFALKSEHPVLHGYAVAWGMVCELYLSHLRCGFPKEALRTTIQFIKENYGSLYFTCDDYDSLYDLMKHDKKNVASGVINFTLLGGVGDIRINQTASQEEIYELLDFYRETMG